MAKQNGSSSKLADPHGEAKWSQLRAGQLEMLKSRGRKGQKRPKEAPPFLRRTFALPPLPGRSMRNVKAYLPPAFGEAAVQPRKISFALTLIRHTRLYNIQSIFGTQTYKHAYLPKTIKQLYKTPQSKRHSTHSIRLLSHYISNKKVTQSNE